MLSPRFQYITQNTSGLTRINPVALRIDVDNNPNNNEFDYEQDVFANPNQELYVVYTTRNSRESYDYFAGLSLTT